MNININTSLLYLSLPYSGDCDRMPCPSAPPDERYTALSSIPGGPNPDPIFEERFESTDTDASKMSDVNPLPQTPLTVEENGTLNISNQIDKVITKTSLWNRAISSTPQVQKGLLVLTTATAIISIIPPLKLVGSLATRSIALLSSSVNCIEAPHAKDRISSALKCAKVAIVAIGLIGIAASQPLLIIASLAADVGVNALETIKAIKNKQGHQAAIKFTTSIIDSLVLAAIATGSWQLMLAASSVSAIAMAGFAIKSFSSARTNTDVIEPLCYTILAGIGVASAISASKLSDITRSYFQNTTKKTMTLYQSAQLHGGGQGPRVIATVHPDQTVDLSQTVIRTLPYNQGWTFSGSRWAWNGLPKWSFLGYSAEKVYAKNEIIVNNHSIRIRDFPMFPIGGNTVFTPIQNTNLSKL